jgi:hypothetical protein
MTTDLHAELTDAYADVSLADPLEQVVRRGRRIRRARRARRVAPALVAAAAVVVGVGVSHGDGDAAVPGPVELVGFSAPVFPLSFTSVPAGLRGPHLSLDPSFDEVGPGVAHAGWSDPDDPDSGIGISVSDEEPEDAGDDVDEVTVRGVEGTVHRQEVTGAAASFSVVWERAEDQWVTVGGSGRFGSEEAVAELAGQVVDEALPVPLRLSLAPRGWELVAYKDDRVLTLADPAGDPATEATARTLTVHLPEPPSDPADLPTEVGATGPLRQVTVHGRPGYLLPTAEGWFLQAALADGTVFVLQAPADVTPAQAVEVAGGVSRP